jgi:transposase-like protein
VRGDFECPACGSSHVRRRGIKMVREGDCSVANIRMYCVACDNEYVVTRRYNLPREETA